MAVKEQWTGIPADIAQDASIRAFLLQALPDAQADTISQLVQAVRVRVVRAGHQIYRQGESCR